MTPEMKKKIAENRKRMYAAVKNNRPDLYERAVQIGHLPLFQAPEKAAASVEESCMYLIVTCLGLE